MSILALGPTKAPCQCVPGVERPECDVRHSPPTSAEVEIKWSYTATPPQHLHVRDIRTFFHFLSRNLSMQQATLDVFLKQFCSSLWGFTRLNELRRWHVIIRKQRSRFKGSGVRVGDNYLEKN